MLGKLIKHELKSYRLPVGITFLVGFIVTIFMKIISMLPMSDVDGKIFLQMFSYMGYTYLIALVGVALQVFVVVRFYSTMVSDRGYLTFTLPVKTSTHIWSKLIGGVIWQIIGSVFVWLCRMLFNAGQYWTPEVKEVQNVFAEIFKNMPDFQAKYLVTIIMGALLMIVWTFLPMLMIYMCMAIGQLFGKWRIFASIASFVIIVILIYVLLIVGTMTLIFAVPDFNFDPLVNASEYAILNGVVGIALVISVAAFIAIFAITNRLFDKHLNLE